MASDPTKPSNTAVFSGLEAGSPGMRSRRTAISLAMAATDATIAPSATTISRKATLSDTQRMRGGKPFVFSNQKTGVGLEEIVAFIERQGLLTAA